MRLRRNTAEDSSKPQRVVRPAAAPHTLSPRSLADKLHAALLLGLEGGAQDPDAPRGQHEDHDEGGEQPLEQGLRVVDFHVLRPLHDCLERALEGLLPREADEDAQAAHEGVDEGVGVGAGPVGVWLGLGLG